MKPIEIIANVLEVAAPIHGRKRTSALILQALQDAGYVIAPVEPTEEMQQAYYNNVLHKNDWHKGYKAMLDAANAHD